MTLTLMKSLTPFPGNTVTCLILGDIWSCIATPKKGAQLGGQIQPPWLRFFFWDHRGPGFPCRDPWGRRRGDGSGDCNRIPVLAGAEVAIHHLTDLRTWANACVVGGNKGKGNSEPGGVVWERDLIQVVWRVAWWEICIRELWTFWWAIYWFFSVLCLYFEI